MPRGKQSGIAFGQSKQKGQSDTSLLIQLANYLNKRWHIQFKREWYVGFDKMDGRVQRITEFVTKEGCEQFAWRNPDLLCIHKQRGLVIIEVDGSVHDRQGAKTDRRNEQYRKAGVHLIIINLREIKNSGKSIEEDLDWKMTKLLQGAVIGTG
jgi:hypothetical protein